MAKVVVQGAGQAFLHDRRFSAGAISIDIHIDHPVCAVIERCGCPRPVRGDPPTKYGFPMAAMPQPGEVCPGFIAEYDRCWRMVYSQQMQATHCRQPTTWTGRWFSPKGDRWFRVWASEHHLEGLTGLQP